MTKGRPFRGAWKLADQRVQIYGLPVDCLTCMDRFSPAEHKPFCPLATKCVTCGMDRNAETFPSPGVWFEHALNCRVCKLNDYAFPEMPPAMQEFQPVKAEESSLHSSMAAMDAQIRQNIPAVTRAPVVFVNRYTRDGDGKKRQARHVDTSSQQPRNRQWQNKKEFKKMKRNIDDSIVSSQKNNK